GRRGETARTRPGNLRLGQKPGSREQGAGDASPTIEAVLATAQGPQTNGPQTRRAPAQAGGGPATIARGLATGENPVANRAQEIRVRTAQRPTTASQEARRPLLIAQQPERQNA